MNTMFSARWKLIGCLWVLTQTSVFAQENIRLIGDVGVGLYKTPAVTRTKDQSQVVLPYVYADYGSLYARVDTFGYKLAPLGLGHIELTTRLSFEGYQPDVAGISSRRRPKPFGIGTFQETPFGAFVFYAFHDIVSGGYLLDATYAAELSIGELHIYPQIGVERRDRQYIKSLYGVSASEAHDSGLPTYTTRGSSTSNAAITVEYPLLDNFKLTFNLRKRWLDKSIYESPLVHERQQISLFLAVTQTFN